MSAKPPSRATPGRGKGRSMPKGYVLGRTATGKGPVQLLSGAQLAAAGVATPQSVQAAVNASRPFGYEASLLEIAVCTGKTLRIAIGVAWTFPATTSFVPGAIYGKAGVAPSADTDLDLQQDGVSIGTARWASGSTTPTLIKASDTSFVAGDYLDIVIPAVLNGLAGPWSLAVVGIKP